MGVRYDCIEKIVEAETLEILFTPPITRLGKLIAVDVSSMKDLTYEICKYDARLGVGNDFEDIVVLSNTAPPSVWTPAVPRWVAPIDIKHEGNGIDTSWAVKVLNQGGLVTTVYITVYWDDE